MIEAARLPPVYRLVAVDPDDDVADRACRAAENGADPAAVFCLDRSDLLDCAIVLAPPMPLAEARLVVYVAMLGLGDALGSTLPPGIDVTFRWPNVIEANMAPAARIELYAPPGTGAESVPAWLVLRAIAALSAAGPGTAGFDTSFAGEGAAALGVMELLPAYARHFLTWMNRWDEDGFAPVRAMWLRHAPSHGEKVGVRAGGRMREGVFEDIAEDGAMILRGPRKPGRIALSAAIGV